MPTFSTPEPVTATIDLAIGHIRITAEDRADTQVDVQPTKPTNRHDVQAADETTVDFSNGRLTIRAPRGRLLAFLSGSVTVTVCLPTDSRVIASSGAAELDAAGRLRECRYKTGSGNIRLETAEDANIKSGSGTVRIGEIGRSGSITSGSGDIHIASINGRVSVRNASGSIGFGEIHGSATVKGASGDIIAELLAGDLDAKTASGSLRIADALRGNASLTTAAGGIDVGIRAGTAAWIDANAAAGHVRNSLDNASGPEQSNDTVRVTARNYAGDIFIRRTHLVD